jgi:hypothetical protein
VIFILSIAVQSFPSPVKLTVHGVMADGLTRQSLAAVTIIQDYPGPGGIMIKDSAYSDSQGKFQVLLLDSTHFSHLFTFEKDGFRTRALPLPLPIDPQTIMLDTVFIFRYTTLDSVTYTVTGSVTDTNNEGVRGAVISITLSQDAATLFSAVDSASQWGGYYGVTKKEPYRLSPVTVHIQVQKPGFSPAEMSQTLASSSTDFVLNMVLKKSIASVLPAARRPAAKAIVPGARVYSLDGRLLEMPSAAAHPGTVIIKVSPDGIGHVHIQLK